MDGSDHRRGLFPALLRHWRHRRGLSQLDLSIAADVSSRHISFLETGRSVPSAEMVLRLATALDVPLRHVDAMLAAAGHDAVDDDPRPDDALPPSIAHAVATMARHHEPFPLVVVDRTYRVLEANAGARAVIGGALADPVVATADGLDLARVTFDPAGARDAVRNFEEVGRALLWRIQREVLAEPDDGPLAALLDELLAMPTVAEDWRRVDLAAPSPPALEIHLLVHGRELRFLTTVTAFQAPQAVLVDELRIETWFPVDDATAEQCAALVDGADRLLGGRSRGPE